MTAVEMSVHINKTKRNQYINNLQKQLLHPAHTNTLIANFDLTVSSLYVIKHNVTQYNCVKPGLSSVVLHNIGYI